MDPTRSRRESPTNDGRRRSVPSAGKGLPGDSNRAAAAVPAVADGVRERADVDARVSVAADADADARRTGRRRARTATDAAASSAPWDCLRLDPGSASSTLYGDFGTRSSPGSRSAAARAPSSDARTRTDSGLS